MVIPSLSVNGLAPEILFFVKKMDAKEFAGRILGGERRRSGVAAENAFGRGDTRICTEKSRSGCRAAPFESKIDATSDALKNGVVRILGLNRS
jgi:hypothetical protein